MRAAVPPTLQAAGCIIGKDYPKPTVDHDIVHKQNLEKMKAAYAAGREGGAGGAGAGEAAGDEGASGRSAAGSTAGGGRKAGSRAGAAAPAAKRGRQR